MAKLTPARQRQLVRDRRTRRQGRAPGCDFRIQDCGAWEFKRRASRASERFDEVVIDQWLHVERLDNRSWYGSLGGLTAWWTVNPDGRIVITHAELREDIWFGREALVFLAGQLEKLLPGMRRLRRVKS